MPGWLRSTPFDEHAWRNVENVSYSLKSDSSFMGFCSGPSGPQKISGPLVALSVSPMVAIMGEAMRGACIFGVPNTSPEDAEKPASIIVKRIQAQASGFLCAH